MKRLPLSLVLAGFLCAATACHSPPRIEENPDFSGYPGDEQDQESLDIEALVGDSGPATELAGPEEAIPGPALPESLALPATDLPVSAFGEIWGYLLKDRENALRPGLPVSDIGYFDAGVDSYGKLGEIPNPKKLPPFPGRFHLVATCGSRSLTHFVLLEGSKERRELIADLLAAARNFDGLQIDFELVPARDGEAFHSFLAELRAGLKGKMLTIALPARMRRLNNDVYDYEKIKPLVDRILVMAYDEHWSTSAPGPVASLDWCRKVAVYALSAIGPEKLIMGLPFYGRAWGHITPSRALVYSGVEDVISENSVTEIRRENGIPTFDYEVPVTVKVYYDDEHSLSARLEMYRSLGIRSAGFWRLGQETPAIWPHLILSP
jgi:hypothetical protein